MIKTTDYRTNIRCKCGKNEGRHMNISLTSVRGKKWWEKRYPELIIGNSVNGTRTTRSQFNTAEEVNERQAKTLEDGIKAGAYEFDKEWKEWMR